MKIECPHCKAIQKQKPLKKWGYGKLIQSRTKDGNIMGPSINCSRFQCKCKKFFIFYETTKGKTWTNPKPKNDY
jgi:hypothetical protein